MLIKLVIKGPAGDNTGFFQYETDIDVNTDEEAEFAGRDFARLVYHAERGMVDAQKVAYQTGRSE